MRRFAELSDIPGEPGPPLVGHMPSMIYDLQGWMQRMVARHGPVFRTRGVLGAVLWLTGPEANELVLVDADRIMSSELGWGVVLDRLFPGGLMLMDFEHHRHHRRIVQVAFKAPVMRSYFETLNARIGEEVARWPASRTFGFYDAIKRLTLDIAVSAFVGLPLGDRAKSVNANFTALVAASTSMIRVPIWGSPMWRGTRARRRMVRFFLDEIPSRRGTDRTDLFSVLCNAVDEDGERLTDQEIADHMVFMLMAAHDTLTSSASSLVYELARPRSSSSDANWQRRLRQEHQALSGPLTHERLAELPLTEWAFKEALRLRPPLVTIQRLTLSPFAFGGYDVPEGTMVVVSPAFTHWQSDLWPDPLRFDPQRFAPESQRGRSRYAWCPFGGGAHMCIGMHFATMQMKVLMHHVLSRWSLQLDPSETGAFQMMPIVKPRSGLRIRLEPAEA